MKKSLDVEFVRSCFPTFQEPLAAKTAFFENAGGSYVAAEVLEKLTGFYRTNKVQPYGSSAIAMAAGEQMDAGRDAIATMLGLSRDNITIGASTTQNINTLAIACTPLIKPDSSIIVSEQDHEANIGAWARLCQRQHAKLIIWPVNSNSGELELADLQPLIEDTTKLVCITHSSNIIGTVNPVGEVISLCRPLGIRVVVDGVSYAPHHWPDIPSLKPDAYCFSSYKTYATHLGIMYIAPDFSEVLDPQCHYFNTAYPQKRFDSSGPDHAAIAALAGLGDYFTKSHTHHFGNTDLPLATKATQVSGLMQQHESTLCERLLAAISDLPIKIIGRSSMQGREANVSLCSTQYSSAELCQLLARHDIATGHGHFYAMRLLQKTSVDTNDGVLRISFAHYNSASDVERLIHHLQQLH